MLSKDNNSNYTIQVDKLIDDICGLNNVNSLYAQARIYFQHAPAKIAKINIIRKNIDQLILDIEGVSKDKSKAKHAEVRRLQQDLQLERKAQRAERLTRLTRAIKVCEALLLLTEGDDFEETQLKSSKFLTTVLLFSPGKGKQLAELHQTLKPAYKAVLSVRLLDKLILSGDIKNSYILALYDPKTRYQKQAQSLDTVCFTQSVIIPVMLAAMFQDVGLQHQDLVNLLEGENGELDRFRLLEKGQREQMLALNYKYTTNYLKLGLGCQRGPTNLSEQQQKIFLAAENKRLKFQMALVEDANSTTLGSSEIIKVPQIYASVVFSTKRQFERKSLTTASILIAQLAVKKMVSSQVAKAFVSIVGQFPLGYGIAYIPKDIRGHELQTYEYAIVTGLNPKYSEQPICRPVSKKLMFVEFSVKEVIEKERNLHFHTSRKKLEKIDSKRLAEILTNLTHNFKVEDMKNILPYFWEPYEYFYVRGNQKLWD